MLNVGHLLFLLSFLSLLAKLVLSQYVDLSDLDLEFLDSSSTYIYDFIILACCFAYFKYIENAFIPIFYAFLILLFTYSLSSYLGTQDIISGVTTTVRWFIPFFLLAHYASYFRRYPDYFTACSLTMSVIIVGCLLYGIIYFPMAINRFDGNNDGLWWPAYFNNLHTTCYVAASVFFLNYVSYSSNKINLVAIYSLFFLVFFSITFGWGIRTVSLSLVIFAYSIMHERYLGKIKNYNYFALFFVIVTSLIWFLFYFDWDYYSRITSGRLSMYEVKFDQLMENGFIQWIFGNGAGSDIVETSFWWGAKGAHSDLITSLVEGGLIFLAIFIYLHYFLYNTVRFTNAKYLILPVLFSGVVSNGFLSRPVAMYILMLAIAGFYSQRSLKELSNVKTE